MFQKEREAKAARNTSQKVVASSLKDEIEKNQKLSVSEHVKGDIMIKFWESKLAEYKIITKEVNGDCQGIFNLFEKDSLNIRTDGCSGLSGEINIVRHQLKSREELKEIKAEISNIKLVNIAEINKWMVASSLRLENVKFTEKTIESQLPDSQRRFFSFEANEIPEVPKILISFLGKCVQCIKKEKESSSTLS